MELRKRDAKFITNTVDPRNTAGMIMYHHDGYVLFRGNCYEIFL
jgi:hypothetical protein